MDTTQLLYLAGAFLLGFFFAWFAGRSGPKHALEECEANAHSLQRSLDDSARSVAKLEGQLKEQVVQVDRLGTEKAAVAAQIAVFEQSAADSGAELAQLQQQLNESQSERLRLETELGHIRDAYADTRSRLVELTQQAEADKAAAETEAEEEAAAVEELIEDTSTALALAEASHTADLELLTGQVRSLETELSAARAALARLSAQVALRPELTPGKRQEYAALAGDPDRIIAALHERDVAVVDARGEVDYLRRTIGMLTAMGAELANEVERRRREQQLLVYQVAGLTAVTRNVEMKRLEDTQAAAPAQADLAIKSEELESLETRYAATSAVAAELQTQLEERSAAAAELQIQLDERSKEFEALKSESGPLQANLDELQAQIEALNAAQADLEAQLEAHDAELTETKDTLATLQTDAESTAAAKAGLEQKLQAQSSEWDGLLARINALNDELAGITAGEPAEEAAPAESAASAEAAAPSDEVAALATGSEAAESTAEVIPEAARAADAAIPVAAEQATEQAVEPSPESAPVKKEVTSANAALAKLSAGVAAAVALFKRKNAKLAEYDQQVNVLAGDKSTLESTVAAKDQALVSTQSKVEELQTAMSQRSARFDALSMHASSLEAEMEIRQLDRNKLEEQVRQVAADLQQLAATYGTNGATAEPAPNDDAAPATETAPAAEPAVAAPAETQVETPVETPTAAAVEVSSIDALNAGAVAVAGLVRGKQSALEDAKSQLAALQEQLATYTAAKDALAAELESRGLSLSDVQTQLESLQGEYAGEQGARGELESKLQELDSQLQAYLVDYGDPEDVAQPTEAAAADAAAQGEAVTAADAGESAPAEKVGAAASVAALGTVLKRRKDALASASAQIAELENEISVLTSEKSELESQVQQKEQALAELTAQYETAQADIATLTTDVETLKNQLEASQAELTATEEERQRLAAQLDELNTDLASLAQAWEAGDEDTVIAVADKLMGPAVETGAETGSEAQPAEGEPAGETADGQGNGEATRSMAVPLAKTAGAVAVAGAIRNKQLALKEASAQLDSVQQEQAALTTAKADLEAQYQSQTAALEEAKAQLEALQQQIDAANVAHSEELQVIDQKTAELQAQYNEAEATRLQLQAQVDELTADQEAAKALLAERDSAVQEAETKLEAVTLPAEKTISDFKASARAAAEARGVEVHATADVQDLSLLKHIGATFEQRLYRAGAGTFWEVAHMTDDDFELVLRLTEMQQLAMDMNEVRSDAVRLAEETETVGMLSEGETPDDFEPIQGIGKIFEQRLYSAGIRTYRELANTSEERLAEICQARKPLVPDYASWIRQARTFMEVRGHM